MATPIPVPAKCDYRRAAEMLQMDYLQVDY
jgi:hypothetical protein